MTVTRRKTNSNPFKSLRSFKSLVIEMPPRAITDDVHYENMVEAIDQLLSIEKLTKGQESYLETLVQLVQAYEANHYAIDTSDLSGRDVLQQLLIDNEMSASDLARLLGVHPSMGSKILKGERSLTVPHLQKLADRFQVSPELFIG